MKKQKLESLNSVGIKAFKGKELFDTANVLGGDGTTVTQSGSGPTLSRTKSGGSKEFNDCLDSSTKVDVKFTDGSGYDHCSIGVN